MFYLCPIYYGISGNNDKVGGLAHRYYISIPLVDMLFYTDNIYNAAFTVKDACNYVHR